MTVGGSYERRDLAWVAAAVRAVMQVARGVAGELLMAAWAMTGTLALPRVMAVVAMSVAFDAVPAVLVGVSAG
jgi:hypothetical protein